MLKKYVISKEMMYGIDARTINEFGISSLTLMELAGSGCAKYIANVYPLIRSKIVVLCGKGKNGGDGFVIARWLHNMGADVDVILVGDVESLSTETLVNYELAWKLGVPVELYSEIDSLKYTLSNCDLVVDALLGIGFKGELEEPFNQIISCINNAKRDVVAIDIPSGLDAESGLSTLAVESDYTLTIASLKTGMILNRGRFYCGKVEIIDISIPDSYYEDNHNEIGQLITQMKYPERNSLSHKGEYGRVVIIAGKPGYSGAAILCSKACLKSGAGLISLIHPKGMEDIFETSLTEVMTYGYNSTYDLDRFLADADVVLIGPGLGQEGRAIETVKHVLNNYTGKLVIDADGINICAKHRDMLKYCQADIILTPHLGEFSRLCNCSVDEVNADVLGKAREFVAKYKVKLLVKSSISFYIDEENLLYNISGNDGLSTGGSGDVLSGIITSFIGQKMSVKDASINGSYYLGKISEYISKERKSFSILPSEIVNRIGMFNI
ncbi:MAG: hypothetical protein B6226_02765 [Candidatus Cloacimonetes bacterium 4572_65]|nr:MAG: hypothetical protein B6226_02765 [Candidatus Cloacimonetes bacterium 4572_65]